ncbi:MAG: hypothetical protein RLW62_15905, partial [Gammaproteobacteria bacterium]
RHGMAPAAARAAALRDACLADWARRRGIAAPSDALATAHATWCAEHAIDAQRARAEPALARGLADHALAAWLLAQEPGYFGFAQFSADAELLHALRLDGHHATLAAALAALPPTPPAPAAQAAAGPGRA